MIAVTARLLWRTTVPAVGLAAAFVVGWRLAPALTVLVVVCAWLPLGLWCLFAPPYPGGITDRAGAARPDRDDPMDVTR